MTTTVECEALTAMEFFAIESNREEVPALMAIAADIAATFIAISVDIAAPVTIVVAFDTLVLVSVEIRSRRGGEGSSADQRQG